MILSRLRRPAHLVAALLLVLGCAALKLPDPDKDRQVRRLQARASYEQGLRHLNEGRVSLGLGALRQAIELDPDEAVLHNALGVARLQLGEAREAQADFERAVAVDPTYSEGYHNLGLALFEQKRYEEAVGAYRKALTQPIYATPELAYYNLAQVYLYHLGRRREAEEALRAAVKLAPRFARAYYELGVLLNLEGRKDEARRAFVTARDLEPDSPVGRAADQALRTLGGGG